MAYPQKQFEPKVTKQGTELPLMNLQGKPYLQVAHRLVWFREECPTGSIVTEFVNITEEFAIAKASIILYSDLTKSHQVIATGFKKETLKGFPDYIEKAETGAVGRALAMAGYGTQFDPTFDEEDRLADSPVTLPTKNEKKQSKAGAGNSNRADEAQPGAVQGNAASGASAPAPQQGSAPGAVPAGVKPLPETANRQEVNSLLTATSKSIVAKRILTKEEIQAVMQSRYGTSKKEELNDEQAQSFLQSLHNVNNGIGNLGTTAPTA